MIYKNGIQNIPVSDSPNNDAFEAVVELYYQLKGYITCSGKWYWYAEKGKQQRGYQDFDVLAINSEETVIVSVSSNLDDKVSFNRNGKINEDKLKKLKKYFERSEKYLQNVPEYEWLIKKREIKRVVAYLSFQKKKLNEIKIIMKNNEIELLSQSFS